jgi:hypothetical protein
MWHQVQFIDYKKEVMLQRVPKKAYLFYIFDFES